ncbi:MAG: NfeD family protein, partial [Luteibacter jiangsuensis]
LGPVWGWRALVFVFAVFALGFCLSLCIGGGPRRPRGPPGNERLNRRGEQLIGQRYVLCEAILNGRGKAKVGDGTWLVTGPDLPLGATVEVVGIDGTTLRVKAADIG